VALEVGAVMVALQVRVPQGD
jgi:hypothetical protein